MNLARRAHQPPGRLVNEDGLRSLPLARRAAQGQSGVFFLVWELVHLCLCLEEPLVVVKKNSDGDAGSRARYALANSKPFEACATCSLTWPDRAPGPSSRRVLGNSGNGGWCQQG